MKGALQGLFTEAVVAVETRSADLDDSLLWPEEHEALGDVVPGRRWDYVSARRCARVAIEALGHDPVPILSGERREPLWPGGVVGALTHTTGYAAAAVARQGDRLAVGIDAEPDAPLPQGVLRRIAFDVELSWLEQAGGAGDVGVANPDRLLFSAKESIYKVWYPTARRWLGFEDARIAVDPDTRTFEATIREPGPFERVRGRYASVDGVILTAIELHP